jgi:hypothetical protein
MRTSTPYVAPGTCTAPERGRGLENWGIFRQWIRVERGIRDDVKGILKGVVISPNWIYNNTFGVHINELPPMLRRQRK